MKSGPPGPPWCLVDADAAEDFLPGLLMGPGGGAKGKIWKKGEEEAGGRERSALCRFSLICKHLAQRVRTVSKLPQKHEG